MEAGFVILLLVVACVFTVVGMYIERLRFDRQDIQGDLNVYCDDPHCEPGLFLGLTVPINDVVSRKHVIFNVNVIQDHSHE